MPNLHIPKMRYTVTLMFYIKENIPLSYGKLEMHSDMFKPFL